jgi:protein-S-isoprenylcysteine O-methyltransferase Ste14
MDPWKEAWRYLDSTGKTGFPADAGVTSRVMSTTSSAIKTALFTLFVPAVIAVAIPQAWLRQDHIAVASGIVPRVIGGILISLGAIGYFWCAALFVRAQGTPAPAMPTQKVVAEGLYRINRNPMYTSVLCVVFGQALLYCARFLAAYGIALAVGFHLFVMLYEEPTLRARFGESYDNFCRAVPRWIPRLSR